MKKLMQRVSRGLTWMALAAALTGCLGGGSTSDEIAVTPAAPAPVLSAQPSDAQAMAGGDVQFSADAAGTDVTWTWQRSTDGGTTWAQVPNATAASLTLIGVTLADDNNRYRAVAARAGQQTLSSAALLTVSAQLISPSISVQLAPQQASAGGAVTLAITATGTALQYQWQSSRDGLSWVDVAAAAAPTLVLQNLALDASGTQYRVVVSNSVASVMSDAVTLVVTAPAAAPAFAQQPSSVSVTVPNPATFTVTATGQPTPTLQWQRSNDGGASYTDVVGATGGSHVIATTTLADNGTLYRVVASNSAGTATSVAAVLNVSTALAPPVMSEQPLDIAVVAGQTAAWTTAASGVPAPAFQWQISTDGGSTFVNINGATSSSYSLLATTADNGKRYRAVATNSGGSASSHTALLTVTPPPSGLEGRNWTAGHRFNDTADVVLDSTETTYAGIDSVGRVHVLYASFTVSPEAYKIWVARSLPGSAGAQPTFGTPTLLATSSSVLLPGGLQVTAGGSARASWSGVVACPENPQDGCGRIFQAAYDAASDAWGASAPVSERELALSAGKVNDVGDQAALVLTNGGLDFAGGYSLAWRQRGRVDIETLPITSDLFTFPAGFALDNNGGFVVVLSKIGLDGSRNVVARRGSIRTQVLGPEEALESRSAPASIDGVWSNASGQMVVMWNQNNGSRVTEYAATLDAPGGVWTTTDTQLPSQANLSPAATLTSGGNFYWYSWPNCATVRRLNGVWSALSALPAGMCANSANKPALAPNGNVLMLQSLDGRWATFDAARQALVTGFAATLPSTGTGYVLGTRWSSLPGTVLLSDSGIGAYVSVNSFDVLPSATAPNGDSRATVFKNIWGLYFK